MPKKKLWTQKRQTTESDSTVPGGDVSLFLLATSFVSFWLEILIVIVIESDFLSLFVYLLLSSCHIEEMRFLTGFSIEIIKRKFPAIIYEIHLNVYFVIHKET